MITASIIYGLAILPAIYAILLRKNPFRLLCCVAKSLLTGIGTASSCATIPITLSCFEKKKVVDRRLAEFLLPIATVTNISGTAIYIAVSAIFLVQTYHPNILTFTSSVVIW
ncbi:excitatory amino acid transporter 1 [Paramuricea clavata]|uniref:Amino acid transporter n=1 Tax=Paramuricea clavata TaxID=317549 RepID=A0A7D9L8X2_PARCT|nr:excitatory amino acid transporter 1 [Paramuricea clavata]